MKRQYRFCLKSTIAMISIFTVMQGETTFADNVWNGTNTTGTANRTGGVSIGTTNSPSSCLTLYGNNGTNTSMFDIYTKQAGTSSFQKIVYLGPTGSSANDGYFQLSDNGTAKVNIAANNSRGGSTYFNGGGNFGIGTISPGGFGSGATGPYLNVYSSSGGTAEEYIGSSATAANSYIGTIGFATGGSSASDKRTAFIVSQLESSAASSVSGNMEFYTNSGSGTTERMRITANGSVGIGTTNPGTAKLAVNGTIKTKEVIVTASPWPDYVFKKDYNLKPLNEVEAYIQTHRHLEGIPTEKDVKTKGVAMGDMQAKLLRKIEEITMYTIAENKLIEAQNKKIEEQNKKIEFLLKANEKLNRKTDHDIQD